MGLVRDWGCRVRLLIGRLGILLLVTVPGCTNDPYPAADADLKILYTSFTSPPKTLDPAVAYSTTDHAVTGNIFDTLLEYQYLKRPYTLIPGLAAELPKAESRQAGRVAYRFQLRAGVLYQDDACFSLSQQGRLTREVVAADVAFALARLADPAVNSPVIENFTRISGFREFSQRLQQRREADPSFATLPVLEQYASVGGIEGVRALSPTELEIVLEEPYPQILYWFAMPFTAPMPWEAVAYYDGRDGRDNLADHPVGAGPFRLTRYNRHSRIVMERNANWYGLLHPEWHAPGATYPIAGAPGDAARGLLNPRFVGKSLPFLDRIELRRDQEPIPAFLKFLQGYYDAAGVIRESFDHVIREGALSPEMAVLGIKLEKSVIPAMYYLGFNMDDSIVGAPAGERGRKLRQAMSLAIDAQEFIRLFMNGRGIPAQSPIPPGIFGYNAAYRNPYRRFDLTRAAKLLHEAGYPRGIDPDTARPLRLTFDTNDTSARGLLQFQFFVNSWQRLGIDVGIEATNYNQFQEKVRNGAYQIFWWGWVADYPDPENFLFLLYGPMARTHSGGPNTANFDNARYNTLFLEMRAQPNDPERLATIDQMLAILARDRPWIELFYPEDYALIHSWLENVKPPGLSFPTAKYRDVDPLMRNRLRTEWNQPIRWPAYALALLGLALAAPGAMRIFREER